MCRQQLRLAGPMSLIFGGKLLAPKLRQPKDHSIVSSNNIQSLSQREQELLDELQVTRSNIVRELIRISPEVRNDDISSWKSSLNLYNSNLKTLKKERPKTTDVKLHQKKRIEIQSKTLQSLPMISSTGDFSLSFKTKREDPISLPILTLPAVRPATSHQQPSDFLSLPTTHHDKYLRYDYSNILLDFDDLQTEFMLNYFTITISQWREIVANFGKVLCFIKGESTELRPTVFSSVKRVAPNSLFSPTIRKSSHIHDCTRTLPPIDHESNSRNTSSRSLLRGSSLHSLHSTTFVNTSQEMRRTRKQKVNSRSRGNTKVTSPVSALRQELLTSLGNMQHYTAEV